MIMTLKRFASTGLVLSLALLLNGCGKGDGVNIKIDGLTGPDVSLQQDYVVVDMTYEQVQVNGTFVYDIPGMDNSSLNIEPATNGGTKFNLMLSIEDILDEDWENIPPQMLPGGRALPGVVGGTLPAVAFTVPEFHNVTVYVGEKVLGTFAPVDALAGLPQDLIVTHKFYIDGNKAGNVSIVGPDSNDENAGALLLLDFDAKVKKYLRKYLKKWRKKNRKK